MSKIVVLDELTINKIAAGEVVDRPSSIVKELVENSIDAGATEIVVEIKNGGIKYIKITDNGCGFESDDLEIAFERHATSKIRKESDILNITSMGFRGEALASVAAISKVTLISKNINEDIGNKIVVEGGNTLFFEPAASKTGTSITVENVFYNVPARYKFLKKDSTESGYIETCITRLALANPNISFKYINSGKQVTYTTGNGNIIETAYSIFGKDVKDNILVVTYDYENLKVSGIVGTPKLSRGTRQNEFAYINSRYVTDKVMTKAMENAFNQKLSIGKFPFSVINIEIEPSEVDVNVHPAKLEVKFENEQKIYHAIYYAIKETLLKYEQEISPFKQTIADESKNSNQFIDNDFSSNNIRKTEESSKELSQSNNLNNSNSSSSSFKYIPDRNIKSIDTLEENKINIYEEIKKVEGQLNSKANMTDEKTLVQEFSNNQNINGMEIAEIIDSETIELKNVVKEDIRYRYVGSVFDTYIIIQIDSKMYIVDQHAAHERLLYENIKENYYSKKKQTQMLLIPEILEITQSEMDIVIENIEMFELAGFVIEKFGDREIKITGVPNIGYNIEYKEMFMDSIDELMGANKTTRQEKEVRFIYTLACKAAVKANMKLTKEEQVELIDSMIKLDNPFTCPHGRPTAYEISKYEIERRFLRK